VELTEKEKELTSQILGKGSREVKKAWLIWISLIGLNAAFFGWFFDSAELLFKNDPYVFHITLVPILTTLIILKFLYRIKRDEGLIKKLLLRIQQLEGKK
jgi:hypothetical protein